MTSILSSRAVAAQSAMSRVNDFYFGSRYGQRRGDPEICDFTFGNPHEMPLPGLVEALRARAVPENKDWFAYKTSEPAGQAFLADAVGKELGLDFAPADFSLTAGAFGAIATAFRLLLDPGDETIFSLPPWFCYESMLLAIDAVPVKVPLTRPHFDLDLEAIEAAITERTRLVIVNTPNNPTGRIYDEAQLKDLADLLERASARIGRRIFLLSDEPYRRIRFDERDFISPATLYPWTLISYSYGKVMLAPGQRIGYLATSPLMPAAERGALQKGAFSVQVASGWGFPNALLQHALPDLEALTIDMTALARKRDVMLQTLRGHGYDVLEPEGTFYLFASCPGGDEGRCLDLLGERDVFVMPGEVLEAPGHFRICLTASQDMIERSLPVFAEVGSELLAGAPV